MSGMIKRLIGESEDSSAALSPMMAEYRRIHSKLPEGTLLLYPLGDFWEFFFEDAEVASRALGIELSERNGVPMAAIPAKSAEAYIAKLLHAGIRVAVRTGDDTFSFRKLAGTDLVRTKLVAKHLRSLSRE